MKKYNCILIYSLTIIFLFTTPAFTQQSNEFDFFDKAIIYSICEDRNGNIWFSTFNNGVVIYDGNKFYRLSEDNGMNSNMVQTLMEDNLGNIWIGLYDAGVSMLSGLKYLNPKFTHFANNKAFGSNEIYTIIQDKKGNIWFGCIGGGVTIFEIKSKKFKKIIEDKEHYNDYVQTILEDKNGNLWFGTREGGINILDPNQNLTNKKTPPKYTNFTTNNGLSHNEISAIIEDKAGNIWIGTQGGGISKLAANQVNEASPIFVVLNKKDGLKSNKILSILEDRSGDIWFGTDGEGVSCYDGKKLKHFTVVEGLSHNIILTMMEDKAGNIWFGTEGGGVTKYEGKKFIHFTEKYIRKELVRKKKLEKEKIRKKYQQAIANADLEFKNYNYKTAKKSYKTALEIKPSEKYPKIKINEIDKITAAIKAKEDSLEKVKKETIKKETIKKETVKKAPVKKSEDSLSEKKIAALSKKKQKDKKLKTKKNLLRKSEYEKEIIQALAEEENKSEFKNTMSEAEKNAILLQLKPEKESVKIQQALTKNQKEKSINAIKNKQIKDEYEKNIILALAEAEQEKEKNAAKLNKPQKTGTKTFKYEIKPEIIKRTENHTFNTIETTIIKYPHREDILQKITYIWGNIDYYKNDVEIDEKTFLKELAKFVK